MPLTKEQLKEIKDGIDQAEKHAKDARSDIVQAKRAGIDVTDMDAELKTVSEKIRRMRAVYR